MVPAPPLLGPFLKPFSTGVILSGWPSKCASRCHSSSAALTLLPGHVCVDSNMFGLAVLARHHLQQIAHETG